MNDYTCNICCSIEDTNKVIFMCNHELCLECYHKMINENINCCPYCREEIKETRLYIREDLNSSVELENEYITRRYNNLHERYDDLLGKYFLMQFVMKFLTFIFLMIFFVLLFINAK